MATDIAFALGVLAVLGSRVNPSLRLFLLTLAIVDDIGAIVTIAAFYSDGIRWLPFGLAALLLLVVGLLQRAGIWPSRASPSSRRPRLGSSPPRCWLPPWEWDGSEPSPAGPTGPDAVTGILFFGKSKSILRRG
ncbi:MAG TPA: Na+/H+ antiporter NhaA [Acidimicrobiales bacterium]|nr:Na+/H+ antiporter NhaA [Acidimicrobiales bacterium]